MLRFLFLWSAAFLVTTVLADQAADDAVLAKLNGGQLAKTFQVQISDADGNAIAGVTVTPWALRSSQGHGLWSGGDDPAEMPPEPAITSDDGIATIRYPFYREVNEQTRTFSVSVNVTHPDYTIDDAVHIDVPLLENEPHKVEMKRAASITLIPQSTSADFHIDQVHVVSSDRFTSQNDFIKRESDKIVFQKLNPAPFRAMMVRLVDGQAVEFSDPIELTLQSGPNDPITVSMHPAVKIKGRLADEVPRPVTAGRISAIALPRPHPQANFNWMVWAAVDPSGDFVVKGWPRSETVQIIALCDGFIAANGRDPNIVPKPVDNSDPLSGITTMIEVAKTLASQRPERPNSRPQVFTPDNFQSDADQPITIAMSPMVRCEINVVDPDGGPLADVYVAGGPNVFYWNWGSQIYGELMDSAEWMIKKYEREPWDRDSERGYDIPFYDRSDQHGAATVYLPPGRHTLFAHDKDNAHQLPIFMGRRDRSVTIVAGETMVVTLQLEKAGTETLGEYDKLAGVVFGCSTREGQQICALPEVRQKMNEFSKRLLEADNPRDPAVLAEAFAVVAEAFDRVGDIAEAAKWQAKADAEQSKL